MNRRFSPKLLAGQFRITSENYDLTPGVGFILWLFTAKLALSLPLIA